MQLSQGQKILFPFLCFIFSITSSPASEILDQALTGMMESSHLPGLAALIVKDGEEIWRGNYGWADMEDQIPVTDSTSFMLASISKTFCGVALMQLWEEELFALDDPVNDYLDFPVVNQSYPDTPITFRQVLTHSSGIKGDFHPSGLLIPPFTWGYDHPMTIGEFMPEFLVPGGDYHAPTNYNSYAPGTAFDYSSVATTLIALLIEEISGEVFEDYCREHIFEPLEMDDTSWFLANINRSLLASHYAYQNGSYTKYLPRGCAIYPCGWLKTSIPHLKHYMIALMQKGIYNGVRILEEATVDTMTTVQFPSMPTQFQTSRWGLMIYERIMDGMVLWGHEGGSLGAVTLMYYNPEENTGVLMSSNGQDFSCLPNIAPLLFEYAREYTSTPEAVVGDVNTELLRNYPNPFRSATSIHFRTDHEEEVNLGIYSPTGRLVKTVLKQRLAPGDHSIAWDGLDNSGNRVENGIYLYRLEAGRAAMVEKMIALR